VVCGEVEDYRLSVNQPTPTPSPTVTPTSTPSCGNGTIEGNEKCDDGNLIDGDGCDSNCTPTGCGNGIVTAGEQCDDGNLIDGDGCDSNCKPSICLLKHLIPGYCNSKKNDCLHEFCSAVDPEPTDRFNGKPGNLIECTDDDPDCDFGPPGDRACTFRFSLCFNVTDKRFNCTSPQVVERVRFRRPKEADDIANRDAMEAAVLALGMGASLNVGAGTPGRRAIEFSPPLTKKDVCTAPVDFKVSLPPTTGRRAIGRGVAVTVVEPPRKGLTSHQFHRDGDFLQLICHPKN